GRGDVGEGYFDPVDLRGGAHKAASFLVFGRGYFDLKIVNERDQVAASIGAEFGGLFGSHYPQYGGSGSSLFRIARVGEPLGEGREVHVLCDFDALARRRSRRHFFYNHHQVFDGADRIAFEESGGQAAQQRAGMDVRANPGLERLQRTRGGQVSAALARSASPVEAAADHHSLGTRTKREIGDPEVLN